MSGPPAGRVGSHYQAEAGRAYFSYQQGAGELLPMLELAKFQEHVTPTDTVVDFGCGAGALLAALDAGVKVGVEVNPEARTAAAARGLQVVASTEHLDAESADLAISNHALEHTLAPLEELRQVRRVLRPGGKLVLWVPLDDWRTQRRLGPEPNHHLYTWTPVLLANLLAEAGFTVVECKVVTRAWPPGTRVLARLPHRLFDVLARGWAILRRRREIMAVALR